jgi:hypothetical protein
MPITMTVQGKTLLFLPNGDVAVSANNQQTVQGAWRTAVSGAEPKDNKIRYTLGGADQTPIQALYSFTDPSNQLQVILKADDGTQSNPFVLLGSIAIDDGHDFVYNLLDDKGDAVNTSVTVYGSNFHFAEGTSNLTMDLESGGEVSIVGDSGINSLEAAENHVAGFNANDLLHFHASTDNTLADGSVMSVPADLSFIGTWDIQNNSLKFFSKITGDITKPDVHIGFAGKIGAVTAGFVYFADSAGTQLAFNISGQHVWKAGNNTTEFNWQSTLGFSQKSFDAKVKFDLTSKNTNGRNFSVNGDLTLQQPNGGPLTMSFHLKAQYQWKNNFLVFKADVRDVAGALSYELMLEGTFKLNHGSIQFAVKFSNAPSGNSFSLDLNFQGDKKSLIKVLSLHLQISQGTAGTMINATAQIELRFVKGVGVLAPVTPA